MRQQRQAVLTPLFVSPHKLSGTVRSATMPSQRQITVIEMGGFHSTMLPVTKGDEKIGGAAYVADAVTRIRQKADPILISNGDVFTGQTTALESGGNMVIQFMNQLCFDAMTLGIHDFDEGQEVLAARIAQTKFPVLAANLVCEKTNTHVSKVVHPLSAVRPYTIIDRGLQTVIVLGLMKEETPMFQLPKNLVGLKFWSAKQAIFRWLPDLQSERPDIIVIQYNKMEEAEELALQINEVIRNSRKKEGEKCMLPLLIFIGGHLDEKPITGHNYLIMQGTDRGYRLGVIKIKQEFRVNKLSPEYTTITDKRYLPDPRVAQLVQEVKRRIKMQDVLLGHSKLPLQRAKFFDGPLGILITEAMKKHAKAEVAFLSSGTTKLDICAGDVYSSDIDQAIPFKDSIILMELTGATVMNVLEQSARLEADSGGSGGKILQVAGIRFKYSVKLEKGKRVIEARINEDPIAKERKYMAAVSKYLVDGGDGYTQFGEGKVVTSLGILKDVVKEYVKACGTLDIKRDMRIEYIGA